MLTSLILCLSNGKRVASPKLQNYKTTKYNVLGHSLSHFTIATTDSCCQITFDSNCQSQEQAGTSEIAGKDTKKNWAWKIHMTQFQIEVGGLV